MRQNKDLYLIYLFIPLWKALMMSLPLILLKLELYIQMAMFCVYTFTKTGFNYLSGIICIILYVISQKNGFDIFYKSI